VLFLLTWRSYGIGVVCLFYAFCAFSDGARRFLGLFLILISNIDRSLLHSLNKYRIYDLALCHARPRFDSLSFRVLLLPSRCIPQVLRFE
jgi:hypothetical protein